MATCFGHLQSTGSKFLILLEFSAGTEVAKEAADIIIMVVSATIMPVLH